jgi:hypothetical protein
MLQQKFFVLATDLTMNFGERWFEFN